MEKRVNDALDLGSWLGRKQAFSLIAGKCSAADAQCLRQIREQKGYRSLGMNWEKFCATHLGISRNAAEKTINLLNEFGAKYFELSAVVRVTPEEYRRIAGAVSDAGVTYKGRTLEIAMHNAPQLSEAVQGLREEAAPPAEPAAETDLDPILGEAWKSIRDAVASYRKAGDRASTFRDWTRVLGATDMAYREIRHLIERQLTGPRKHLTLP